MRGVVCGLWACFSVCAEKFVRDRRARSGGQGGAGGGEGGAKKKKGGESTKGITKARRAYTDKRKTKIAELRALKDKRIREFNQKSKKMPKEQRDKARREYKKAKAAVRKQKSARSAAKRFKVTATGKLLRHRAGQAHLKRKKRPQQLQKIRRIGQCAQAELKTYQKMLLVVPKRG